MDSNHRHPEDKPPLRDGHFSPPRERPGEINHLYRGRGVYFDDPIGHLLELITRP
jgi:hypothetical protein